MDFVGLPVYSWGCAAGHAIRMAARLTGRHEVLRAAARSTPSGSRSSAPTASRVEMARPHRRRRRSAIDPATGGSTSRTSKARLSTGTAAVYFEIAELSRRDRGRGRGDRRPRARAAGAETIVGVDPISLGVLAPPGDLRRRHRRRPDAAARRAHELRRRRRRLHRLAATRSATPAQYPTLLVSIADTTEPGERGFGLRLFAPDLLRLARGGQRLDRQLGLPLGGRQRRLHGAARARRASPSSAS